ncbi:unnamed protein product, partial [Prunus brigantina]
MSRNPFLDQVRSSFQRSRSLNAGTSFQPNRVISEIQNRLERELETAKEQAIATFESLAIHTDLLGSSPSNSESSSDQEEEEEMAANEFMGDLDIPTIPASPSSILLPTVARNYELKSSHLNMLPSFYGLPNEDPLTHIKDIFNVVSSFPLTGVTEDQLRMRVFPYTLKDKAKYWLNSLKPGSLTTWGAIQKKFLEKYFSTQKTDMLRDKILLFAQQDDESFCEAWERFNGLLNQCPHHGIPLKLQMRMFYKGLTPSSHNIVTNFAGGSYKTKTPEETYELFEGIAMETQHTDTRGRLKKANQDKAFKEIYDILSKVNINLPLLDVVKQIPAYGKFIKHLITHKLNFAPSEEVKLNKNVSAVLQRKLPPKLEDPGSFDIPINIGDKKVGRAMLDLGASINVMPYSVYQELGLEGMKKTSI